MHQTILIYFRFTSGPLLDPSGPFQVIFSQFSVHFRSIFDRFSIYFLFTYNHCKLTSGSYPVHFQYTAVHYRTTFSPNWDEAITKRSARHTHDLLIDTEIASCDLLECADPIQRSDKRPCSVTCFPCIRERTYG